MRATLARKTLGNLEIREGLDGLTPARIATLYRRAPLVRPIYQMDKLWQLYEHSSLVLTAWHNGQFVGLARVLSDGVLYSYLCDLAVEPDVQGLGIGSRLLQAVLERCKGTELILHNANLTPTYFKKLGFKPTRNAWIWNG